MNQHTSQKLEFDNEDLFNAWMESETNKIGWLLHDRYCGSRESTKSGRGVPKIRLDWSRRYICPFSGKKRATKTRGSKPRLNNKESMKVGCKASIRVQKFLNDDKIIVHYKVQHLNHAPESFETWRRQRLPPAARKWLKEVIETGTNWEAFKSLIRPSEDLLNSLEIENENFDEELKASQMLRVGNKEFNNYRRGHLKRKAHLDSDCWISLCKYQEEIQQMGGIALLQDMGLGSIQKENSEKDFLFAFCTSWQITTFRRYQKLLCLDSTHNTCFSLDSNRKAFLHSVVIQYDDAGCGIPVPFMITNIETMTPLLNWLDWLQNALPLEKQPTFMIDCSKTEVAALKTVFPEAQIRFCHWHFFRALNNQVRKKISISNDRSPAMADFRTLLRTKNIFDFNEAWDQYQSKYGKYSALIEYLESQWMQDIEKWWNGYRMGMQEIHTNNLVESWHNTVKSVYLRGARKQRTDILVYKLLREVLVDLRWKVVRISVGLQRRRTNLAEQRQLDQSNAISFDVALDLVVRSSTPQDIDGLGESLKVRSFTQSDNWYEITIDAEGSIVRCSCPYMSANHVTCKHMFIASRVSGYNIDFGTRDHNPPVSAERVSEDSGASDRRQYFRPELDRMMSWLPSLLNRYEHLEDSDKEIFNKFFDNISSLEGSCKDRNGSWSQRQHR